MSSEWFITFLYSPPLRGRGLGRGGKCHPETLSRICNVHSSSRTNSFLSYRIQTHTLRHSSVVRFVSQRERAKDEKSLGPIKKNAVFTLAEGATHVDMPPTKSKLTFTLAEVLITFGVIGLVAALTMPTLLKNIAERSNSEAQANLAQKITKSMDLMRADGGLERTYASSDNYWAGAKKACDDIGMSLPDTSKLKSIYEAEQVSK